MKQDVYLNSNIKALLIIAQIKIWVHIHSLYYGPEFVGLTKSFQMSMRNNCYCWSICNGFVWITVYMFELDLFSIKTISNACTAVFIVTKSEWTMMSKGTKAYTGDRFELVRFSITIIFKIWNVLFNVWKVHEIRRVKVLRHLSITSNSWISDTHCIFYGLVFVALTKVISDENM